MKEKEQSSIEWPIEELDKVSRTSVAYWEVVEKAKDIHKSEIEDAFNESRLTNPMIGFKHNTFEQYYNEKYSK